MLMMCFIVGSQEEMYQYGWMLVSVMVFTTFVNLTFVLFFGFKQIYLISKKYYRRIKAKVSKIIESFKSQKKGSESSSESEES